VDEEGGGGVTDTALTIRSCYLAGPMRGYEEFNFPAFHKQAAWLRANGWKVVSPAELDEDEEAATGVAVDPADFARLMGRDLAAVCAAEAVVLMDGWEGSTGARLEAVTAVEVGKPVFEIVTTQDGRGLEHVNPAYVRLAFFGQGVPDLDSAGEISFTEPDFQATVDAFNAQEFLQEKHGDRHPNSARFHTILEGLGELHDEKQKGYGTSTDPFANVRGSERWGVAPWLGAMIRANDKIVRLQSYAQKGSLPFESVEDAFRDLAVYAIIGLCLFEEEQRA
jgi:hypothetical protein